jgi:STE24 endopeptidase
MKKPNASSLFKRFRFGFLSVMIFSILSLSACQKAMTPTESRAIAAANLDHSAYTLSPEKLEKAVALSRIHVTMLFVEIGWNLLILILLLQFGIIAKMRDHVMRMSKNRWAQCFVFFFEFTFTTTLLTLPISVYLQQVALQYGTSVQNWPSYFLDELKSFAILYAIGSLGVMLLFFLIRKFPKRWWLCFWFPTMAFAILSVFLEPYVIAPLFDHFEPLSKNNSALVDQLEKVVARGDHIHIPPERMFLMQASEKVTTLNAYVSGFGASKRVVVWDTSIAKGTIDEISFIFGHEMGHYVLGHIVQGLLFSFVMILICFFLGFHLFQWMLKRFGKSWGVTSQEDWSALPILVFVITFVSFFMGPIFSTYSRNVEHAADVYGQEAVHGIIADPQTTAAAAFQLLGENSFANPYPSPFVEFWMYSHPPIGFRAAFAKHYNPWAPGESPKYFQ